MDDLFQLAQLALVVVFGAGILVAGQLSCDVEFRDRAMLKLRRIGLNDYNVIENDQRIGRIRYAVDRTPRVWIWYVQIQLTGDLPMKRPALLRQRSTSSGALGRL